MKKRLSVEILSGSCCGDPGRSRHLDLSKEIQNICTGNRDFTERSLWNTHIAAAGGMEL